MKFFFFFFFRALSLRHCRHLIDAMRQRHSLSLGGLATLAVSARYRARCAPAARPPARHAARAAPRYRAAACVSRATVSAACSRTCRSHATHAEWNASRRTMPEEAINASAASAAPAVARGAPDARSRTMPMFETFERRDAICERCAQPQCALRASIHERRQF